MAFWGSLARVGVVSVLVLSTAACTKETIIEKEKAAPKNMRDSFSTVSLSNACDTATCIKIQKSSLGKIFLLMASGVTLGSAPQWYDLKPLVVSFKKNNSSVALVGENYTSIYNEIQGVNLIQSFRIVEEDEMSITFDWGKGLSSFIADSPYDVDAPRGKKDLTENSMKSIPVIDSFVENVKVTDSNIELTQLSKIRSTSGRVGQNQVVTNEEREESLTMNIQIRAYNLGADFKKKEFDKSRRAGFFVTKVSKPSLSQDLTNLITKWDISPSKGPIRVRISNAVPAEYVQAVVEGVNYWNKVFGREVPGQEALVAVTGVDPQAGPEDRSIMIRWIPWLDAGAAYALGQSDPLTGEVLRAQVFMPAVFTKVGSSDLVELNDRSPVAAINGAIACDFSAAVPKLEKLMREAPESARLRLAQDSVRSTVAHELGHALGLRHNFAGSFSSKVTTKELNAATKTYLKDLNHQGLETSTSIMDYVGGVDNILMAARLKYQALTYDKMAMEWAYSDNDTSLDEKKSLYCTDDDIAFANSNGLDVYGCERFDAGSNPLARKFLDAKDDKDTMIPVLFASIIGRLYPGDQPSVVNNLDQVLEDTKKWAVVSMAPLDFVGAVLQDRVKNGSPENKFASLKSVKTGQALYSKFGIDPALTAQKAQDLKADEIGGYANIFRKLAINSEGEIDFGWYREQVVLFKQSAYLKSGKTLAGREYTLSDEDQKKIVKFFEEYTEKNEKAVLEGLIALVPKIDTEEKTGNVTAKVSTFIGAGLITETDAQNITGFVSSLLTVATEQTVKVGEGLQKETKIPTRKLSTEDRLKYLPLLSSVSMKVPMLPAKNLLRQLIVADVVAFVGQADPTVNVAALTPEELGKLAATLTQKGVIEVNGAKWLNGELKLISTLDKLN